MKQRDSWYDGFMFTLLLIAAVVFLFGFCGVDKECDNKIMASVFLGIVGIMIISAMIKHRKKVLEVCQNILSLPQAVWMAWQDRRM